MCKIIKYSLIAGILAATLVGSGCADEDALMDPGNVVSNSGTVSQKHFFIALDPVDPTVIDLATNTIDFTVEVDVIVSIADRNNQILTDSHTVYFETEYGVIEPSCITVSGQCGVTWSPSGYNIPADNNTTFVAYTGGEEAFLDPNNNGTYDDGETFFDVEEPWVNLDSTESPWVYDIGVDILIDTINANDFTASNKLHDVADGLFNGQGCTHSSLCSTVMPSTAVWDAYTLDLTGGTVAPAPTTYTVGGTIDSTAGGGGVAGTETLVIQNNVDGAGAGDDITFDDTTTFPVNFTFTAQADGSTYEVTVFFDDASLDCTATAITGGDNLDGTGTIAAANVTDIVITCD
jgi:hypothetical protein